MTGGKPRVGRRGAEADPPDKREREHALVRGAPPLQGAEAGGRPQHTAAQQGECKLYIRYK